MPDLNSPLKLGSLLLKNRNIMASLTRNRSVPTNVPNALNIEYYGQRAIGGASLILTEGTLVSQQGTEWPHAPGIWSEEQVKAWTKVVDAIHSSGSFTFLQLWHVGRVAHPDMPEQKRAGTPVPGPSAIAARGGKFRTLPGKPGYVTPTVIDDPWIYVDQFRKGAQNAKAAGFDGVELHSANGYLVHQFLDSTANQRSDEWGGSIQNRCKFGLECLKAILETWEPSRVGIKINPCGGYNDVGMSLEETKATFGYYLEEISKLHLAYVQIVQYIPIMDPEIGGKKRATQHDVIETYGPLVNREETALLINGTLTPESANELISSGKADGAVFGNLWIGQPDFQRRIEAGLGDGAKVYGNPPTYYAVAPGASPRTGYGDYEFVTPLSEAEKEKVEAWKAEAVKVAPAASD
ncbi:FMN-linked oxidoreductase [Sistotremastrum niveocremeum HHB9708]|uniref:FMN-linked oxidoreductase n=1 Tax=Sistotremastrum niveocremeum HHB9708 TaxID=1314777 RepID=A0A164T302_9AGAM|nr:FMN-linked oxidoreductase [Sistotremastrum niveocremeum HHB9708]